jgi:macrodomain Ter protein organizer (MatP/YcbG family)
MARGIKKQANREQIKSIKKTVRFNNEDWNKAKELIIQKGCTFSALIIDLIRNESDNNFT